MDRVESSACEDGRTVAETGVGARADWGTLPS